MRHLRKTKLRLSAFTSMGTSRRAERFHAQRKARSGVRGQCAAPGGVFYLTMPLIGAFNIAHAAE